MATKKSKKSFRSSSSPSQLRQNFVRYYKDQFPLFEDEVLVAVGEAKKWDLSKADGIFKEFNGSPIPKKNKKLSNQQKKRRRQRKKTRNAAKFGEGDRLSDDDFIKWLETESKNLDKKEEEEEAEKEEVKAYENDKEEEEEEEAEAAVVVEEVVEEEADTSSFNIIDNSSPVDVSIVTEAKPDTTNTSFCIDDVNSLEFYFNNEIINEDNNNVNNDDNNYTVATENYVDVDKVLDCSCFEENASSSSVIIKDDVDYEEEEIINIETKLILEDPIKQEEIGFKLFFPNNLIIRFRLTLEDLNLSLLKTIIFEKISLGLIKMDKDKSEKDLVLRYYDEEGDFITIGISEDEFIECLRVFRETKQSDVIHLYIAFI